MSSKNVSYPHPVLGVNDDVLPELEAGCVELTVTDKKPADFVFGIKIRQANDTITRLIKEGKAEYACEVQCRDTFMRCCYRSSSPEMSFVIGRRDICGFISFDCFIALKEPLKGYNNPDFNEDYRGYTFDLDKGDLLAIFPQVGHNVDIRYDKLYAAGTYMQIAEGDKALEIPQFNLQSDKINIELPQAMFKQYLQFANTQYIDFIHASLVYNALVFALREWYENHDEYQMRVWCGALDARIAADAQLKSLDFANLYDIYKAADVILGNPYQRMFDKLQNIQ